VSFLYRVEYSGKLLHVKRIKILRASREKTSLLKVTLQVNTYNPV
jgi:hypothetical protein